MNFFLMLSERKLNMRRGATDMTKTEQELFYEMHRHLEQAINEIKNPGHPERAFLDDVEILLERCRPLLARSCDELSPGKKAKLTDVCRLVWSDESLNPDDIALIGLMLIEREGE
jgi:hypothetical protein